MEIPRGALLPRDRWGLQGPLGQGQVNTLRSYQGLSGAEGRPQARVSITGLLFAEGQAFCIRKVTLGRSVGALKSLRVVFRGTERELPVGPGLASTDLREWSRG